MLKAFVTFHIIMFLLFTALLVSAGAYMGITAINNYQADIINREGMVLDQALIRYSANHIGVNTESITFSEENGITYWKTSIYPADKKDLEKLRDELNYFSKEIDLSEWTYRTEYDGNGSMTYDLRRKMLNGAEYHTPNSTY